MGVKLIISNLVKRELEPSLLEDNLNSGGILLGTIDNNVDNVTVTVSAVLFPQINSPFLDGLNFAIWQSLNEIKNASYPDLQIVGWFLSSKTSKPGTREQNMHTRFFNKPNQILLMLSNDGLFPYAKDEQCFANIPHSFAAGIEYNNSTPLEQAKNCQQNTPAPRFSVTFKKVMFFTLMFVISMTSIAFRDITKPITEVKQQVASSETTVQPSTPAKNGPSKVAELPVTGGNANQGTLNGKEPPAATPNGKDKYIVQKGDSLWSISQKYYGSGFSFLKIMQQNNVMNPNSLYIGQVLEIPKN